MPNRRYRGAIIGLGGIARNGHLPGFLRRQGDAARLAIVACVDPAATDTAVGGIPVVRSLADLDRFGPLDFVDVCTPTASHVELSIWALERGLHVLCEKPVAVSGAEAETLAAAARRVGRVLMPCHQYRFNPAWLQLKKWLEAGRIGAWRLAEFQVYRQEADRGSAQAVVPWRAQREQSRGGIVLDHGTHLIYEMLDVAGPPSSVQAWTTRLRHQDYDVEDTAQIVLQYPDKMGVLFLTWAGHHRETRIRFVGELGWLEWRGGILEASTEGSYDRLDFASQLDKASYADWFSGLFGAFARAMDAGGPDEASLDDLTQVALVLGAIYDAPDRSLLPMTA